MEDTETSKPNQGPVKRVPPTGGKPVAAERPERHSANPKVQSYGAHEKKEGSGKANWGKPDDTVGDEQLDKGDPLYDESDPENEGKKKKAEAAAK